MKISIEELLNHLDTAVWNAVELYESEYEDIRNEMRRTLEMLAAEGKL